jgi:geranylgeranyl pyrophosphate synthase
MPRTIETLIQRHARRVEAELERHVPRAGVRGLSEAAWYHLDTGGKRIRPALCLIACETLGGDPGRALPFAAGVELLHNMLLVHDDIEDGDIMRRNKPTVWKAFGLPNAVNVGDYLLGRALAALLRTPGDDALRSRLMTVFIATYERTLEGQALDINARSREDFRVDDYMRMAMLKTGHYLVLGMIGGALIAGAPEETLAVLREFGESIGPAFQIRDDLIDLTAGKGRGGVKGSDIREGKASILYAHALAHAAPADRLRLVAIMRAEREATTDADVAWVINLYQRAGSMRFAEETADALVARARQSLDRLPPDQRAALGKLLAYIAERTS